VDVDLPAGKAGTLTTRTNNTDGAATLSAGHGILTADVVDIYWDGGCRYGAIVGTVEAVEAGNSGDGEEQSQATMAANMAANWDLWHTPGGDAYATIPVGDHLETWPLKSQTFKRYVAKCFFDEQQKAMNSDALSAAINLMEAKSLFEGEEHTIHVRVGHTRKLQNRPRLTGRRASFEHRPTAGRLGP
jgi:hypothetical protein